MEFSCINHHIHVKSNKLVKSIKSEEKNGETLPNCLLYLFLKNG